MITHESWKRIKEIFQSAQELSPAERSEFLDQACGDDKSIREEVEAMLTADASNDDFLTIPAYEFAAEMLANEETEFSAGQKVGRYTILCPLGAGGMGQIYLAEDSQLNRKIALKLISSRYAHDAHRVERFKQEALAASALNHPNICVIHDMEKTERGRHFIAMEYIQGVTLRDKLSRGPLNVRQALNLALQVADALSATHATRIVHRDIKPENIMVRPDGYVKVLDFGLAKLTEVIPQAEGVPGNVHSEVGMLMGTVKYMSPEQLRETRVDERTDIWSLGVVLYEMLTGVTPFEAGSSNDTIAAILDSQPAPFRFPKNVPKDLQEILSRALEKNRDERYQTVTKFATDLKVLRNRLLKRTDKALDSYPVRGDEQQTQKIVQSSLFTRLKSQALSTTDFLLTGIRTHKKTAVFTGVTGVLVLLFFLPTGSRYLRNWLNPPQQSMTWVTNAGTSVFAAVSRDGKWIVHTDERGGNQRLVLINTATSTPSEIAAAASVRYVGITFSQDGNWLYFTRFYKGNGSVYRLALPGGAPPVKIKDDVDSPISFSPKEDRFAFVRLDTSETVYSLVVSTIDGLNEQVLDTRKDGKAFSVYGLTWSPDGAVVVCPVGTWSDNDNYKVELMAVDVATHRTQMIGDNSWHGILEIAWQDDMSGLILSGKNQGSGPFQLWRISYPDGALQLLTRDLAEYRGVSLSGQDIVTVRTEWWWDLAVADRESDFTIPWTIASGGGLTYGLVWAGNQRLVFSAMSGERLNISRVDVNGSNQVKIPGQLNDSYSPAISADGRFVVFSSNRTGKFNIWRMNLEDGSDLKQLTFTDGNFYPDVSSDNQWVTYDNQQKGQLSVWKVPLEGGNAIKVADKYRMPVFSPDNELIAARYDPESGTNDAAIFLASGGEPIERFAIPMFDWQRVHWLSQNTLSYIDKVDGYPNIWSYDRQTKTRKQLTHFTRNQILAYQWSPDNSQLACQLGTKSSNVVRIKNSW